MNNAPSTSIALLIDADNSPASKVDFIFSELAGHGVVNIRRAYGNWKKPSLGGWEKVLHQNSIQPIQHFDLVKGKNATDIALVIDALDILYTKEVQTFCLVSSDCDFTPLIQRLRADGKQVFGFGGKNTPDPFINSCSQFFYLDEEKAGSKSHTHAKEGAPKVETANNLKGNSKLMNTLRTAVKDSADDEGWALLGNVANRIANSGSMNHRTFGFKKMSDLFAAIDLFEIKKGEKSENGGQLMWVRIRKGPAPPAKKSAGKKS